MKSDSIAIVGIGGIFPGSPDLETYWNRILQGADSTREVPVTRWSLDPEIAFDPHVPTADRVYSRHGCFVDDRKILLKHGALKIDPKFLNTLDPMFKLGLAAAHQAFSDARMETVDPQRTGVLIGNIVLPTEKASAIAVETLGRTLEEKVLGRVASSIGKTEPLNALAAGLPAGIIAQALGLGGGHFTLDAACASSLYALKLAADKLRAGEADAMITGGLSRPDCLYTQMGFSQLRALSPTGKASPFDAGADGLVVGEGAGMFVIKRLADALAAGDHVYGILAGVGLANDRDGSLLAPSSEGQLRAMRAAYEQAGWQPAQVDLIECHATGTPLGDEVEFQSLCALWHSQTRKGFQPVIGSVKGNIGHLLTAAGASALMKVLLALKHRKLPPTANFQMPPAKIQLDGSPFRILTRAEDWPRMEGPRRAAVSAFGFGGINAHVLIEEWIPKEADVPGPGRNGRPRHQKEPVAIVGMSARFGPWQGLAALRERIFGGGAQMPAGHHRDGGMAEADWFRKQGLAIPPGFYLDPIRVPIGRFRIPPNELQEMLPQQILMLLTAAEALADAGVAADGGIDSGVFVGIALDLNTTHFQLRWDLEQRLDDWVAALGLRLDDSEKQSWLKAFRETVGPALNANRTIGSLGGMVASRIAREFRFGGPSFTLSSEENSGIHALETAVSALQRGELSQALVGAVDLPGDPRMLMASRAWRTFASCGPLKPFDRNTSGTLPGEGAAALVLKRLRDAERDGDRIYAIIQGMGNAGGSSHAFSQTYVRALERAYRDAGITPGQVGYLDACGTGDPREDREEAQALSCFWGDTFPVLGSAKADLGHTGAAAGLASLVKAGLALYERVMPGLGRQPKPLSQLGERDVFAVFPQRPYLWLRNRGAGSRHAALSTFGTDGNCTHVVLREHERTEPPARRMSFPRETLFFVEGNQAEELARALSLLRDQAATRPDTSLHELAASRNRTTEVGKRLGLAFIAGDRLEFKERFQILERAFAAGRGDPENHGPFRELQRNEWVFFNKNPLGPGAKVAFVFPGSGNHFPDMGRGLALQWPEIFRQQDAATRHLASQLRPDIFWSGADLDNVHENHPLLLSAQVALGVAVSDLVRSFDVEPNGVLGYSLGETAGLFALRAWEDRDGMHARTQATDLFTHQLAGPCHAVRQAWKLEENETVDWTLGVVDRPAKRVREVIQGQARVYLLIVNTKRKSVIGGDRRAVQKAVKDMGARFYPLQGVVTVHCEVVRPVAGAYRNHHLFKTEAPEGVYFYSGAKGCAYRVTRESAADAILAQALHGVDFPKTVEAAYADGFRIFLEMGPGASCTRMIGEILRGQPHLARAACAHARHPDRQILQLLASLIAERASVDLNPLFRGLPAPSAVEGKKEPHLVVPLGGKPFRIPPLPQSYEPSEPRNGEPIPEPGSITNRREKPKYNPVPVTAAEVAAAGATATARAHEAYLRFSQNHFDVVAEHLAFQEAAVAALSQNPPESAGSTIAFVREELPRPAPERVFMNRSQCLAFATGSIAAVLGSEFAVVDQFPTRVRLPDEPLMLVDRILEVGGERMRSGHVVTEHDVLAGAWYLDGGRIPACIAIEAGQADLFLSAYLGIDFETKGLAVYRLLDAAVTFYRELPPPGATIHYQIRIDQFFRQGDTHFFRFSFDGRVDGEPLLSMKNGCAGFFSEAALQAGRGIVTPAAMERGRKGKLPHDWEPLVPMEFTSLTSERLDALRHGDLSACFGPEFSHLPLREPAGLPGGPMRLIDRVPRLEPRGGRYGLGFIRAEADIDPQAWFLTCHFVDDRVMPGTLMYECCLHTLRVFLYRMGWVGESSEMGFHPVPGVASVLKCRGQVLESTRMAAYEVHVKELGYRPEPFAIADAIMYSDDKKIVEITHMTLRLTGLTQDKLRRLWDRVSTSEPDPLFRREHFLAFATGKPSDAFGEPYLPFDHERFIARLPGPPFLFLDRVTHIQAEAWRMVSGGKVCAQYDVTPQAWYFEANRQATMPFVVLQEIALQTCGWFAAYMGSALHGEEGLHFRNLGGSAIQHKQVPAKAHSLEVTAQAMRISKSAGMIIQHYAFEVRDGRDSVYQGETYFGFFTASALANQVGIRDAESPHSGQNEIAGAERFEYPPNPPFPGERLRMIDHVDAWLPEGGPQGLGWIRGRKKVNPADWFFKAHFYQDPVVPGSLGLESLLQLLKVCATQFWGIQENTRFETQVAGREHHWTYRGQVAPGDAWVTVEAWITAKDEVRRVLTADGYLSVDGRIIYHMQGFTLGM